MLQAVFADDFRDGASASWQIRKGALRACCRKPETQRLLEHVLSRRGSCGRSAALRSKTPWQLGNTAHSATSKPQRTITKSSGSETSSCCFQPVRVKTCSASHTTSVPFSSVRAPSLKRKQRQMTKGQRASNLKQTSTDSHG